MKHLCFAIAFREQLAVQLIMKELLEQEKSIRLPPTTSKTSGAPM